MRRTPDLYCFCKAGYSWFGPFKGPGDVVDKAQPKVQDFHSASSAGFFYGLNFLWGGIMKKILLGYNGTAESREALAQAKILAIAFGAEVYVASSLVGQSHSTAEDIQEYKDELEYAGNFLEQSGVKVETHLLVTGRTPGEDLVHFAATNDVGMIVIGVRKKSAVGKLIFGSTARYVIINAHCPVMSVK
jgi:nucleotide-binding universal stress UspA family protein